MKVKFYVHLRVKCTNDAVEQALLIEKVYALQEVTITL
jgi:hypothetical protein